jgi:hypothetical protein
VARPNRILDMTDAHHTDEATRWFRQMDQPEYYALPVNPDIPGARTDYSNPRLPQPRARVVTPEFREELNRRMQRLQREATERARGYLRQDEITRFSRAVFAPSEDANEAHSVAALLERLSNDHSNST